MDADALDEEALEEEAERLRPYIALLVVLGLQLVLASVLPRASWAEWLNSVLIILALTVGGWAATEAKTWRIGVVGLAVGTSVLLTVARSLDSESGSLIALALGEGLLLFVAAAILQDVLQTLNVTASTLAGASCVYLLIGTVFSLVFLTVELLAPGSFTELGEPVQTEGWNSYYSLVTLSTLGYGDILPVSRTARALAAFEALIGQLYLTILVARLVGLQLSTGGIKGSGH